MKKIFRTVFLVLGILALILGEINAAQKGNPPWARDFRGELTFDLTDEPGYRQAEARVDEIGNQVSSLQTQVSRLVESIKKEEEKKQNLTTQIEGANSRLISLQAEMVTAQNRINEIATKIPEINQQIALKKKQLAEKEQQQIQLEPQLAIVTKELEIAANIYKEAQLAYRQVLSECQRTAPGTNCELNPKVVEAKKKSDEAMAKKNVLQTAFQTLLQEKAQITAAITTLKNDISSNESSVIRLNQESTQLVARLASGKTELQNLRTRLESLTPQLQQVFQNLANLNQNLNDKKAELNHLSPLLAQRQREFDIYEHNLIRAILDANYNGFQIGERDGKNEGQLIAERLGKREGARLGRMQGLQRGEDDGRQRDYQRGYAEGEGNGANRAYDDAEREGTKDGIKKANQLVGTNEGKAEGLRRAEISDAKVVGEQEGKVAGLNRAKETGRLEGRRMGESESINSNESRELKSLLINGQFAGTFNGQIPAFPGATRERYQIPLVSSAYSLVRFAVKAGYDASFFINVERSYYAVIDDYFNRAFSQAESSAYNEAYAQNYQDSYLQGKNEGDRVAYSREYPKYYDQFYNIAYQNTLKSPNRSSNEYRDAYQTAQTNFYNSRYKEIYQAAFNRVEDATFRENIATQTEINRTARINEVNDIYNKNPILKFVSSSLVDKGVSGVGSEDGIFAPGESIVHSLTIRNMGKVAAQNVKVILGGIRTYTLSEIPALSETTIKGAALEAIPSDSNEGDKYTSRLSVKVEGNLSDGIVVRHFERPFQGLIAENKERKLDVKYPISLANFKLSSPLILGQELSATALLANRGSKAMKGPISVELTSSEGQSIIIGEFASTDELLSDRLIAGAKIKVENENLVFSTLNLQGVVKVKNVVVGKTENLFSEAIKFGFFPTSEKRVVVYDSLKSEQVRAAKELLARLGGINKLSVIDLNPIFTTNRESLERKIEGYSVLLITSDDSAINSALKNKNVLALLVKDANNVGRLGQLSAALSSLKSSVVSSLKIAGKNIDLVTANPYVNVEIKSKNTLAQIDSMLDLERIKLLENLKLTSEQQLALIRQLIKIDNSTNPGEVEKMAVATIIHNVLTDVALHQKGFVLSDENADWAKRLSTDTNLMAQKLVGGLTSGNTESKLPLALVALGTHYAIDKALDDVSPFQDAHRKVIRFARKSVDDIPGEVRKFFKKELRNMDLFDQLKGKEAMYFPF